jgi:hypothetical protein
MSKPIAANKPLIVSAVVLFGLLGFVAGRFTAPSIASLAVPSSEKRSASENVGSVSSAVTEKTHESSAGWDQATWNRLQGERSNPSRNKALTHLLRQLAISDPKQAMALAEGEKNRQFRETLVLAVLNGWGAGDPDAALRWAKGRTSESDRYIGINAVFAGAVAKPEEAIRSALAAGRENIADATECATSLIRALSEVGDYRNAIKLAASTNEAFRGIWMAEAYSRWAVMQPEDAAQAAASIADPQLRAEALHGVVSGWSEADPAALTQYLTTLPKGTPGSTQMLGQALMAWARVDQPSVLQWVGQNDLGAEADDGIAAVASAGFLKPEEAALWTGCITDPKLRSSAMLSVLQNWWGADPEGAQKYFARATGLLPEDRQKAEELLMLSGSGR